MRHLNKLHATKLVLILYVFQLPVRLFFPPIVHILGCMYLHHHIFPTTSKWCHESCARACVSSSGKCDMSDEMKQEAMELCVTAAEKYADNYESVSRMIKEAMDKKFGASWHTVVGEGYGFEITYQLKHLLYMYCAGNLAICIWKSA
ncbi:dynein light chain 4, axonemal isoform X1 [Bombus impatiens]|uniref:Dynein light chain n=1 Tax=Bombus impatiens TaxID=132113 RepID=A0A6P6FB94_BOMIM|nr:dynein light chain 4, axonemal isoform X1 [Bombus impatiens]